MLIALLSDIHGNREALSACLTDARARDIDRYVFLGDYVGYGADPGWVVDTVRAHVDGGAVAILGNHDAAIWAAGPRMNEVAEAAIEWTRTQLDRGQREFLERLPLHLEEEDRLYVHANAWRPHRWGYVTDAQDALLSLQATDCRLTFCGHVHVPQLYSSANSGELGALAPVTGTPVALSAQRRWLAVVGSVGQPRDHSPAASYAVYDSVAGSLTFLRAAYDVETAAAKIRAAGLPRVLGDRLLLGW